MPRVSKASIPPVPISIPEAVQPPRNSRAGFVIAVLAILLLSALSIAGYFYYQYTHTSQVKDAKEIQALTEKIGAILALPEGEVPTLATVTDKEKLAGQAFFQKAENGDKVLIYSEAKKAILYRPGSEKIIDVTTVNVNVPVEKAPETVEVKAEPGETVLAEAVPSTIRLALLNGSTKLGVTNTVEDQLRPLYSNVTVVSKETAKKQDYTKTIVFDITGKNAEMAGKLANTLSGEIGILPSEENVPTNADILIVVGQK